MIIWDYVKGLNAEGDTYTFIKFPRIIKNGGSYTTTGAYKITPNIYTTCDQNEPYPQEGSTATRIEFGKILTSYDYIELEGHRNSNLEVILKKSAEADSVTPVYFKIINSISSTDTIPIQINLGNDKINLTGDLETSKSITAGTGDLETKIGTIEGTTSYGIKTKSVIKTNDKCEALYFNATSDQRAKKNFNQILNTDALKWINDLKIYTFDYRINGKTSIGITTQQVQDKPINDFNFVDNLEATGENGDYMTIKESKLVYMCMSAIQELSQQNTTLQEKLTILENELKKLKK